MSRLDDLACRALHISTVDTSFERNSRAAVVASIRDPRRCETGSRAERRGRRARCPTARRLRRPTAGTATAARAMPWEDVARRRDGQAAYRRECIVRIVLVPDLELPRRRPHGQVRKIVGLRRWRALAACDEQDRSRRSEPPSTAFSRMEMPNSVSPAHVVWKMPDPSACGFMPPPAGVGRPSEIDTTLTCFNRALPADPGDCRPGRPLPRMVRGNSRDGRSARADPPAR